MKKFILFFLFGATTTFAQFDIEAYKQYLNSHKDMTVEGLLQEYPAGNFLSDAPTDFMKSEYADSISIKFALTDYEKSLINKHGFMVTERLNYYTFMQALWDVYNKDMPVYISADAILHALHYSFDNILKKMEKDFLLEKLIGAIDKMKNHLKNISVINAPEIYIKAVKDLDVYLSVPTHFFIYKDSCVFPENEAKVQEITDLIYSKQAVDYQLFSETPRWIDFSQFKVRGHYDGYSGLFEYFIVMTWLGKAEILFSNPVSTDLKHSDEDLQRMGILSALISEVAVDSEADEDFKIIDEILTLFVGKQDNINLWDIKNVLQSLSLKAKDIAVDANWKIFREKVTELSSANQLYNSQILFSNPYTPQQIILPSAFLLMGQRPILDGFITANVVFDRILFKGNKVPRMIPSTLDILFSLGNDASIQLLTEKLEKYPYSTNLAALRFLINSYDDDFWKSTAYTCWLNGIRSLNPPLLRGHLPVFMQTAAWWQKTMSTQLASWSELRHDFILYAQHSYSGGWACSYPYGYVEPVPELYEKIKYFFSSLKNLLDLDYFKENKEFDGLYQFTDNWIGVCDTLKSMSKKIIYSNEFSTEENKFINSTISIDPAGCFEGIYGWYQNLYFGFDEASNYITSFNNRGNIMDDFIVADVHTIPTDENGKMVGWVLHAGTGRINMAVITAPTPDGGTRSYIGPVYSYYEFISNDFKRLTNDEWRKMDGAPAYHPAFTKLYLADKNGNSPKGTKVSLFSVPSSVKDELPKNENNLNLNSYPNPFTNSTAICFTINEDIDDKIIELNIYDISGNLIKSLINQILTANNYSIVWDGLDNQNKKAAPGTYIYSIKVGEQVHSGKVNFVR